MGNQKETRTQKWCSRPETLKKYLNDFRDRHNPAQKADPGNCTLYMLIDRFVNGEIKKRGRLEDRRKKSQKTVENYNSIKLHLKKFEEQTGYRIDFDTITLDFFNAFVDFLQNKLAQRTRGASGKNIVRLHITPSQRTLHI
jgi:hypothetical protein